MLELAEGLNQVYQRCPILSVKIIYVVGSDTFVSDLQGDQSNLILSWLVLSVQSQKGLDYSIFDADKESGSKKRQKQEAQYELAPKSECNGINK